VEREQNVGDFSVDLLAEDAAGNPVIIENQLEATDHDHLGKLLVYLSNLDAKAGLWLSPNPRPEHVNAATWLNEAGVADFYLIKVEAVRIGDSPPAPLFTQIVGPSEQSREVGEVKKKFSERHHLREQFWTDLLKYADTQTDLHSSVSPGKYSWVGTGAGHSGLGFNYTVRQYEVAAELYIDRSGARDENMAVFNHLHSNKEAIERDFGGALEWQPLEDKNACRIRSWYLEDCGYRVDPEQRQEGIEKVVDRMVRLEAALRPHLETLQI
jgi:hypothetical protein